MTTAESVRIALQLGTHPGDAVLQRIYLAVVCAYGASARGALLPCRAARALDSEIERC
jgi:hypothetical protein